MSNEEYKNTIIPLVAKLYPMVKQLLRDEEDVKDALQDLVVKLWDKRNEIDSASNKPSYIFAMARNYCLDSLKRKKFIPIMENDPEIINLATHEPGIEIHEKLERVNQIIEMLPEKYREVIKLRDMDGFSFEEISQITGHEIPHLRVILSRSRLKVREELVKIYEYERGNNSIVAEKIL